MTLKKISHIKTPLKNMLTAGLIPITSCALPSDSKFQRTRIRSHHSLYRTSHRVTHTIFKQQLGVIAISMGSKQWGGMLSGRDNRTKVHWFSVISTLLYWLLYKYIHISSIFNKIVSSLFPFAFTLNLLERVVYTQYLYFLISHMLLKPHHLNLPSPFYPALWPLEIVSSLSHCFCRPNKLDEM